MMTRAKSFFFSGREEKKRIFRIDVFMSMNSSPPPLFLQMAIDLEA